MDFSKLVINNGPAIIAISGTLLGVIITQIFNLLNKKREFSYQHKLKLLEQKVVFENEQIIRPTLDFLEKELSLITRIYQKGLNKEISICDELSEHILGMSMVGARLRVFSNDILNNKFKEFTRLRISISFDALNEDGQKDINTAFENMIKAELLASEIIAEMNKLRNFRKT